MRLYIAEYNGEKEIEFEAFCHQILGEATKIMIPSGSTPDMYAALKKVGHNSGSSMEL